MDTTAGRCAAAPAQLVRRAVLAREPEVAALLRDVAVDPGEVADLIRPGGVFVLADLTLPLSALPVGGRRPLRPGGAERADGRRRRPRALAEACRE